uniref:RxLR effector candidate protein n=1 Tax=Hyaloperonospora arabidopsidis (strain Emoy2) TaxID=559515 RepID=M4C5X6_HYAAE
MNIKGILTIVMASMVGCPVTSLPRPGLPVTNCTMVRQCDWISDEPLYQISDSCIPSLIVRRAVATDALD